MCPSRCKRLVRNNGAARGLLLVVDDPLKEMVITHLALCNGQTDIWLLISVILVVLLSMSLFRYDLMRSLSLFFPHNASRLSQILVH